MEINIPLFQGLSLKIGDTLDDGKAYPTGQLQKGFLLLDHGQYLTEEAVGFGVPVLKRGLQTIFPSSVALTCQQRDSIWEITALFKLNLIEKISKGGNENVENNLFYNVKNFMEAVIRNLPLLRGLLTEASSKLRQIFNWETTYADANFSVELKMFYTIESSTGKMIIEVDTSDLPSFITEVVVMNELGAHYFDRYLDTSGNFLQGDEIGCWDEVKAESARFESNSQRAAFSLGHEKDAILFRGRELIASRLAWAGFGHSFLPSIKRFRYEIKIERLS
jgi:hypothetical protein